MFNARWRSIGRQPPVVRRWTIGFIVASILCVIIALAWIAIRESMGLPKRGWILAIPMIFGFLPMTVLWPLAYWRTRWIRSAWRESGGRLCIQCAYNLSATSDGSTCPECGSVIDFTEATERWNAAGFKPSGLPN